MQSLLSIDSADYLTAPSKRFGFVALLILASIFGIAADPHPYPLATYVAGLIALALVAALLQRPRWIVYVLLLIAFVTRLYVCVHVVANGEHDVLSTRDAAVEVAAQAFLRGESAWNANLDVGITTGPASILVALPFIVLCGQINWLSFWFWLTFFAVLLWCDVHYRNRTWPILAMFFILGWFDTEHTLYWSLEELYYPILYLAFAYMLGVRNRTYGMGALLAASVWSRPSYIFLVMGFGLWFLVNTPFEKRSILKARVGFVLGSAVVLLPFVLIGRGDILINNPWRFAFDFSGAAWPDTNPVFRGFNRLNAQIGSDLMRWVKLALALFVMLGAAWGLRLAKAHHPFWHMTVRGIVAHTLVWFPAQFPRDYTLTVVLPAFLAIGMAPASAAWPAKRTRPIGLPS